MSSTTPSMEPASVLGLHHAFEYSYPHLPPMDEATESLALLRPLDSPERHEPRPLGLQGTYGHYKSGRMFESPITLITKTLMGRSESFTKSNAPSAAARFIQDMQRLSSCAGTTFLNVLRVRRLISTAATLQSEGKGFVKISRETALLTDGGVDKISSGTYDIPAADFIGMIQGESAKEPWMRDIVDLISGGHDRAVRCVQEQLKRSRCKPYPSDFWLRKRSPKVAPHVADVLDRNQLRLAVERDGFKDLSDEDKKASYECNICGNTFDFKEVEPVRLKVCGHFYCHSCLSTHCDREPRDVKCPTCRRAIAVWSDGLVNRIKLGLDEHDQYMFDNRFNHWENFERSCFDIDMHCVRTLRSAGDEIKVESEGLSAILQYFVAQAKREPDSSTPHRLKPVHFEEFAIVEPTLTNSFKKLHGTKVRVSQLLDILLLDLRRAWFQIFVASKNFRAVLGPLRQPRVNGDLSQISFRRGFYDFVELLLNRTIVFALKRRCGCKKEGLHQHADIRVFLRKK